MTTAARTPVSDPATSGPLMRIGTVVLLSFLLGGATSWAQGSLPTELSSFANSASGWTVLTAMLVFWSRARTGTAAALGAVSFVLLVLGYSAASHVRGLSYDPVLFSAVGVLAGPFVGLAASWLRATAVRAALGAALLAGIGVGESAYGLTVVRETTSPVYWTLIGAAGLALLIGVLARRARGPMPVALGVGGAALVAVTFYVAYSNLG
ncbi:DUF6518 family protein [Antribacter gilvus]|uniref:DUF6518 family protein n=1 Tax=Antribacter gilvus TaxID=2304675 RepID=UPI000F7758F4|nr:DUF6518 family protein [Antribacter gilvus]